MNNGNISFFSLGELAEITGVGTDQLLREARLGKLVLCAETDLVSASDPGLRDFIAQKPELDHPGWKEDRYFIWLSLKQAVEVTRKGSTKITEALYPNWLEGSLLTGRVTYRRETVIFEKPYTVTEKDLLILDGDAAIYFILKNELVLPKVDPQVVDAVSRDPHFGWRTGGSQIIYPIGEEFLRSTNIKRQNLEVPSELQFDYKIMKRQNNFQVCMVFYLRKLALEQFGGVCPNEKQLWDFMIETAQASTLHAKRQGLAFDDDKLELTCGNKSVDFDAFKERYVRLEIQPKRSIPS